jgi:hypothetical protein
VIRKVVKKHSCPQWKTRFPNLTKAKLKATTKSLERWNGEDYGFSKSDGFITIANTCFDDAALKTRETSTTAAD